MRSCYGNQGFYSSLIKSIRVAFCIEVIPVHSFLLASKGQNLRNLPSKEIQQVLSYLTQLGAVLIFLTLTSCRSLGLLPFSNTRCFADAAVIHSRGSASHDWLHGDSPHSYNASQIHNGQRTHREPSLESRMRFSGDSNSVCHLLYSYINDYCHLYSKIYDVSKMLYIVYSTDLLFQFGISRVQ